MQFTLQKIESVSKKTRIVTLLRDAMVAGGIKSGEPLVEAKIARQLGVGQGVIREALIELEHQGFVQRMPFAGTQVTQLTLQDAQQIYDIRIELEPLAVFLAGPNAYDRHMSELREMAGRSRMMSEAGDLDSFFADVLAFRKKVWALSGNRYLEQTLERMVVPLYALYVIRQSHNLEGILQTTIDCIGHQEMILAAYEKRSFDEARNVARAFLIRMKEYLGGRLLPASN